MCIIVKLCSWIHSQLSEECWCRLELIPKIIQFNLKAFLVGDILWHQMASMCLVNNMLSLHSDSKFMLHMQYLCMAYKRNNCDIVYFVNNRTFARYITYWCTVFPTRNKMRIRAFVLCIIAVVNSQEQKGCIYPPDKSQSQSQKKGEAQISPLTGRR
jgi:hypothetical protein